MHTLQFDAQTEQAISQLAAQAGKNADDFIKDVVLEFLEDQEDIRDAEAVLSALKNGTETTTAWETVKAAHGL
jgi:predicted DNA-binding protein